MLYPFEPLNLTCHVLTISLPGDLGIGGLEQVVVAIKAATKLTVPNIHEIVLNHLGAVGIDFGTGCNVVAKLHDPRFIVRTNHLVREMLGLKTLVFTYTYKYMYVCMYVCM